MKTCETIWNESNEFEYIVTDVSNKKDFFYLKKMFELTLNAFNMTQ